MMAAAETADASVPGENFMGCLAFQGFDDASLWKSISKAETFISRVQYIYSWSFQ